jgi:hypothetical protein
MLPPCTRGSKRKERETERKRDKGLAKGEIMGKGQCENWRNMLPDLYSFP